MCFEYYLCDMRRSRIFITTVVCAAAAAVFMGARALDRNFEISKHLEIFHNVFRNVDMMYVDTVDIESLVKTGINAMLSGLDPYTVYYPEEEEDDLKMMTTGKYAGIGAMIRQYPGKDHVVIEEPYENMPAALSGVRAGDRILRIDGEDMKGRTSQYVSDHLRGEPGTQFTLTVARLGVEDSIDIQIKRANIAMPAVPYYGIWKGAGYIFLEQFTENCSNDVRLALLDLKSQGAKSIVLDLRDNGGGLMNEAIDIVGLFVPKGTLVVETKGRMRSATAQYVTTRDPVDAEIPMAVLINGSSASASEIVAGSLQDLDRAVIIGSRSFGKGLVQTTRSIPFNGALKVTTAKYYIPSGRCIQEIDYSKHKSGTAATDSTASDSLLHIFHTKAGREVRDGGGIIPDISCPIDTLSDLIYYLSSDYVLFDFLNHYCSEHPTIGPLDQFQVTDSLFDAFKTFARESDFTFTSRSSKALKSIRDIARVEGLLGNAAEAFDSLEAKLQYDVDRDFDNSSDDVKVIIGSNLIARYYYARGVISYNLQFDSVLDSAMVVLEDKDRYFELLR